MRDSYSHGCHCSLPFPFPSTGVARGFEQHYGREKVPDCSLPYRHRYNPYPQNHDESHHKIHLRSMDVNTDNAHRPYTNNSISYRIPGASPPTRVVDDSDQDWG